MEAAAVAFALSAVLSAALTRFSLPLARRVGAVDQPGQLSIHAEPTPRFGGSALGLAALLGGILAYAVAGQAQGGQPATWLLWAAGASAIWAIGLVEDIRPLSPRLRLILELLVGLLFSGLLLCLRLPPAFCLLAVAAALWLSGTTNAMNMVDGMNGLAGGLALVSGVMLAALGVLHGCWAAALVGGCVGGACLGFLPYNYPRAQTFMGDGGSLFLGFGLGAGAILAGLEGGSASVLLGGLALLAVPVGDMVLAVTRRAITRRPLTLGDRSHFYDQLCWRLGMSKPTVTLVCALAACAYGLAGIGISFLPVGAALAALVGLVAVTAAALVLGGFVRADQDRSS